MDSGMIPRKVATPVAVGTISESCTLTTVAKSPKPVMAAQTQFLPHTCKLRGSLNALTNCLQFLAHSSPLTLNKGVYKLLHDFKFW